MANNIQESINNAINTIVTRSIDALALDKTVIAIIDSYVDPKRGIYRIQYDGGFFNARSLSENAVYLIGMPVYVQIPQNDMSKDKLIISQAYNLRDTIKADTTVLSLNNFSIIGNNLLKVKKAMPKNGIGIRSYHDYREENSVNSPPTHRAQYLLGGSSDYYSIDTKALELYKKDATALMIEAEFRTTLDETQKRETNGLYGLGLSASFDNVNYKIGETQGEIFDYFAAKVNGTATVINRSGTYTTITNSVKAYATALYNRIVATEGSSSYTSLEDLRNDNGYIDMYKSYISAIIQVFAENDAVKDIEGSWREILEAYLVLLDVLKLDSSKANMKTRYNDWRNKKIASPKTNTAAFVLDSNKMTGNPYNFTNWSTQYVIFPLEMNTLSKLNSILFYKDGFKLDESKCLVDNNENKPSPREDIFVRNVKIYALKPISAENGDYRLEIQTPDGCLFQVGDSTDKTLNIFGRASKAYYQDLSDKADFYWFKKSRNVTSASHSKFHQYGGIGWAHLSDKGHQKKINITKSENTAYENIYKCVAVLDETIILAQEFYIYNLAVEAKLKIFSNLGVNFSFDIGNPTLTCLINDEEYLEDSTTYHYNWAIVINGQRTFLDGKIKSINSDSVNIKDITSMLTQNEIISGVKFYRGTVEKSESTINQATRILYPISNIGLENFATFECYVDQKVGNTYYEIGCATLTLSNKSQSEIADYKIVIENGDQVFQYDEYGNPPNAKKLKTPQEIKPLICHLFDPNGIEIPSGNYTLNWVLPLSDTMLKLDTSNLVTNPANDRREIDNVHTQLKFDIVDSYNEEYQNNQITCWAIYNDKKIIKDTNLLFTKVGENGTNGTDTVARILPVTNNTILDKQPLTLYRSGLSSLATKRSAINSTGTTFNWYEATVSQKANALTLNDSRSGTTSINIATSSLAAHLYLKNGEISSSSITKTMWNIAGATKTAINNNGKHLDTNTTSTTIVWNENYDTSGRTLSDYIIKVKMTYGGREYYAFYPLCIINYKTLPAINRISIDKQFLLKEIMYNADGRNPVYSHAQGVKINNLPKGATVTWRVHGGTTDYTYYDNSDSDYTKHQWVTTADIRLLKNSTDKRSSAYVNVTTSANVDHIYIIPNDAYNGSHCNNRVEAIVQDSAGTVIAVAIIPIYMHLNTFGLASLNAWDGNSVTIDEDNGYVMAPQMGAGTKDTNNRFTGILMGKTETRTGQGKSTPEVGLFGYAHGLQSIFLDSKTGNATFGLPDNYGLDGESWKTDDTYNEGRIELRPGGVSKIGGWRLGHKSLYYTSSGNIGDKYGSTTTPDYVPDKDGKIKKDTYKTYAGHHEKDIAETDSGILIHSGLNPYISIKGRKLYPSSTDAGVISDNADSYLVDGDSLELQLDPKTPTLFTIFRHNGQARKKGSTVIYEKGSRTFLAGINAKGQLMANGLQDVTSTGSAEIVTTFGVNSVPAFGESLETASYVGLKMAAGDNNIAKIFVKDDNSKTSTLYYSGASATTTEYQRPLSFHGASIAMYASNSTSTSKTTTSKIILNNTNFYAGNDSEAYISLATRNSSSTSSGILSGKPLYIRTRNSGADLGNIYLQTRNTNNDTTYSYLSLVRDGDANLRGWTNLYGVARNGNITLRATSSGDYENSTSWTLKSTVTASDYSYLTLNKQGDSNLRGYKGVNIYGNREDINLFAGTNVGFYTQGQTTTTDNNNSYLIMNGVGDVSAKANAEMFLTAYNGRVTINAQSNGITQSYLRLEKERRSTGTEGQYYHTELSARDGLYLHSGKQSYLWANDGNIDIRARASSTDKSRLFLSNETSTNPTSFITAINNFKITAAGDNIDFTLGTSGHYTILNLDAGNNWTGGGSSPSPADGTPFFHIQNTQFGGIQYKSGIKQSYSPNYKNTISTNNTYVRDSAALTGDSTGNDNVQGGLYFNWGWFPGMMYGEAGSGNENLTQTSIFARNKIVSTRDVWYSKSFTDSTHISLKDHTHPFSKGVTVNVYDSDYTDIGLTNAGAGSNATLNVVVSSWANASASYNGGNFEGGTINVSVWDPNISSWQYGNLNIDSSGNCTITGGIRNWISINGTSGFGVSSINAYVSSLNYGVSVPDSETVYVTGTSSTPNYSTA